MVKSTAGTVWIVDDNAILSVTNDAERVIAELYVSHGDRRVIYRDTDGNWDELKHRGQQFLGYAPARDLAPCNVN